MIYLLDSDHTSILQQRRGAEFGRLRAKIEDHGVTNLAFSVVSFHEQVMGCHTYINKARSSAELVRGYALLSRLIRTIGMGPILEFDASASAVLEGLVVRRLRVGAMDLRIAAIALSRDLTLLTRNVGDFGKIPGLRTEDWTR